MILPPGWNRVLVSLALSIGYEENINHRATNRDLLSQISNMDLQFLAILADSCVCYVLMDNVLSVHCKVHTGKLIGKKFKRHQFCH